MRWSIRRRFWRNAAGAAIFLFLQTGSENPVSSRQIRSSFCTSGGHVISYLPHPLRMSSLPRKEIFRSGNSVFSNSPKLSANRLFTASVPAGCYSRTVAEAAEAAGIRALFHSEPVATVERFQTCQLFGRCPLPARYSPSHRGGDRPEAPESANPAVFLGV